MAEDARCDAMVGTLSGVTERGAPTSVAVMKRVHDGLW